MPEEFVEPRVFLVGAGPGDPSLLTLRAVELLAEADFVLYDQLIPPRVLEWINPAAERLCVRDLPGARPDKYPHIHATLIAAGKAGKKVVRLKGGDPLIFGRAGEEAEALREAGVPYEIVPGITAAIAAGSYLEIPLTHRRFSSAVALVTGHELPNKPGNRIDWQALAAFPGTLAVYMGIARLPIIISELIKYGKDPDTPCGIVERASTGAMRSVFAPLRELESARRNAGLESPGLILIGNVVDQRPETAWVAKRPLFGVHVLVTRPRHQAGEFLRKLELLGAVPYLMPTLEIREPADFALVDAVIDQLARNAWDWLVFSSSNGVQGLLKRILASGRDLRVLGGVKLAAVGPKTAATLREYHLIADVVPDQAIAEGLVESLLPRVTGKRVLLARANRGRDLLRTELGKVATVEQVAVYEQIDTVEPDPEVMEALRRGEIQFVALTSSNVARSLLDKFDEILRGRVERGEIQLITISPETTRAVRELGFSIAAEATEYSTDGILAAMVALKSQQPRQ
ncbi:MAG: uroporphyrinogen-III C-methyltransferase [Bacteroidales bacterium]|nr:uroporphyrinogen-III C-methyltransferase [Bacteroidales bacterium]